MQIFCVGSQTLISIVGNLLIIYAGKFTVKIRVNFLKNRKSFTEASSVRLSPVRDSCTCRQSTATAVAKAACALDRPQIEPQLLILSVSLFPLPFTL